MPITESGRTLLEKQAADWSGLVGSALNTGLGAGMAAYDIASGQSSVGRAIGEAAGGIGGWEFGSALANRFIPKSFGNGKLGRAASAVLRNFVVPFTASAAGADTTGKVLHRFMPYQRKPYNINTFIPGEYNG